MTTDNVTKLETPTMGNQLAPLTSRDILTDDALFNRLHKLAELMASGTITTAKHLRGNVADCFAIAMQSARWGMDPFVVSDKTFVIPNTNKIGYESQLVNAVAQTMSPIQDRFHYDYFGDWDKVTGKYREATGKSGGKYYVPTWKPQDEDGVGVTISATLRGESEPRTLKLLLKQAAVRNSVQWAYDPQQQLGYLAVKKWVRRFCPDALMGVYTPDELEPEVYMGDAVVVKDDAPARQVKGELIPKASKSTEALSTLKEQRESTTKSEKKTSAKPDADTLVKLLDQAESPEAVDAIKQRAGHLRGEPRNTFKLAYQKRRDEVLADEVAARQQAQAAETRADEPDNDAAADAGGAGAEVDQQSESNTEPDLSEIADQFHTAKTLAQLKKLHPQIAAHLTSEKEIELAEEEYGIAEQNLKDKAEAAKASQ